MKPFYFIFLFILATNSFSQETPLPPPQPVLEVPEPVEEEVSSYSPLVSAIYANDLAEVKKLVAAGSEVNQGSIFTDSPVKIAVHEGNYEIVKFLIENGATDKRGLYAPVRENNFKLTKYLVENEFEIGECIVYAAENNNLKMVTLLASNGADVDFSQKRRTGLFKKHYVSPIGKAVSHNNLAMIEVLVKYGLPVKKAIETALDYGKNDLILSLSKNLEDKNWLLIEAFRRCNDPIVSQLIAQGVSPNAEDENGNSMLLIAAEKGDLTKVKTCVEEHHLDIHKENDLGENALMKAADAGSRALCSYLLEQGISLSAQNNKGETALFYSLRFQARSTFDFLVQKGADVNHKSLDGNTLLIQAAMRNHEDAMTYLLSLGVDVKHENKQGKTAFHYVISDAHGFSSSEYAIQNRFIQAGADINTRDRSGETVLFKLIERGRLDRVIELVEMGADPNTQDKNGERPACSESKIIQFLVKNGADINATDNWDNTYLCEAVKQNDLELAYFLVNHGIDVNKRCYFDEQAIIKAVKAQNLELVQFIAENGADLDALGRGRKNVMDCAQEKGDAEIIKYLRSRGAMTKEEKNKIYKAAMRVESEIKASLIAEDLEAIISIMSSQDVIMLQEKTVQSIAYVAAKKGHTKMMNKLLSSDVQFEINSPVNQMDQTILFIATIYNQDELVLDLLAKGADINIRDKNGKNAASFASKRSTKKIYKKWLKNQ